ncbi:hypothetical protein Tco_0514000 [Tanacetum coccineum]
MLERGLYVFKNYTPPDSQTQRLQTEDVLTRDDLKHYEAEIKYVTQVRLAKRLTEDSYDDLFDYLSQYEKLVNASRAKKLEKDAFQNNYEDPLTSAMMLLARAITQRLFNPTNNHLRTSSNTINQAIVQADRVNNQSRNSGNDGINTRRSYVQEEVIDVRKVIILVIVQSQKFEIQSDIQNVNSGSVVYDNNVQASYELEQLAIMAYKEAKKQQINANKADSKARRLEKDLQTQFIRDQDIIRDLEQQRDNLQLTVVELKSQIVEL